MPEVTLPSDATDGQKKDLNSYQTNAKTMLTLNFYREIDSRREELDRELATARLLAIQKLEGIVDKYMKKHEATVEDAQKALEGAPTSAQNKIDEKHTAAVDKNVFLIQSRLTV